MDIYVDVQECFAERLKFLREEEKLTQEQLAKALGVSRGSISFYENCDRVPDIIFLVKAADHFRVGINYLLGYSDNKYEENEIVGGRLDLSDEVMDKWALGDYGEVLNDLIENKHFDYLMEACKGFLFEENWRKFKDFGVKASAAYALKAEELEEYRAFLIAKLFTNILIDVKDDVWLKKYDKNKANNTINETVKKIKNFENFIIENAIGNDDV